LLKRVEKTIHDSHKSKLEPLRRKEPLRHRAEEVEGDKLKHKKAKEMLNTYHEEMIRAEHLASLGTLSTTLAHELTQPLTVIRLGIENVLADLETNSCPRTTIKQLNAGLRGISNLASIASQFRNFAGTSSEGIVREVDLKAVADRIVVLPDESAWRAKVAVLI